MKFYGRVEELKRLSSIRLRSQERGCMTVITGRRRVGKTRLILESFGEEQYLYFFVARKDEKLLCEEFSEQVSQVLGVNIYAPVVEFRHLFRFLLSTAKDRHINLCIDEFQEFLRINPSVYSDIQNLWDQHKEEVKMNLILCGSIETLMIRIFESYQEPLYGRANHKFRLRPLSLTVLRQIVDDLDLQYNAKDFLTLYTLTGGMPTYVEAFVDSRQITYDGILTELLQSQSFLMEEGRSLLVQEFGKDHLTYFSILALIAAGKTTRGQIESVLQKPVGGHISQLGDNYRIINRLRPLFSKEGTTNVRYFIDDNFLRFWFRFIYSNQAAVNSQNFSYLRQVIDRDFATYAGLTLERLIRQQLMETKAYSAVGNYWKRGNKNEIDVIATNEMTKQALIGEVKMNPAKISLDLLKHKAQEISRQLKGYEIEYRGFSLEDILS